MDAGVFITRSRNLAKNLADCGRILVFAATLGTGADYLIGKYNRLQMSKAVVMQAAAAAMIEEYCDQVCAGLKADYEADGWYLRPRFSPGYGDLPLALQPEILQLLDAQKRLGLTVTPEHILIPRKSVTAIIGLADHPLKKGARGCATCRMRENCMFRKGGTHC